MPKAAAEEEDEDEEKEKKADGEGEEGTLNKYFNRILIIKRQKRESQQASKQRG